MPQPDNVPPKVYYEGAFGRILLTPTMLLDAGWILEDGVWIAPPSLLKAFARELEEEIRSDATT